MDVSGQQYPNEEAAWVRESVYKLWRTISFPPAGIKFLPSSPQPVAIPTENVKQTPPNTVTGHWDYISSAKCKFTSNSVISIRGDCTNKVLI
jgi:hypothetical protein